MSVDLSQKLDELKKEKDVFNKSKLLKQLIAGGNYRVKDLAQILNKKSSYICHLMRLLRIPEIIVDGYYSNLISLSHLFILSRISDKKKMIDAYEKVLTDDLTVSETENLIREILYSVKTEGEYLSQKEKELLTQEISGSSKNMTVEIIQTRIKSKLVVEMRGNLAATTRRLRTLVDMVREWRLKSQEKTES